MSIEEHLALATEDPRYFDRPEVRFPNGDLVSEEAALAARIQTIRDMQRLFPKSSEVSGQSLLQIVRHEIAEAGH